MSSPKQSTEKKILIYYFLVAVVVIIIAFLIIGRACITSFSEGEAWKKLGEKQVRPGKILATRGDIYSADYELMATTETRYRLFLDFWAEGVSGDTLKKYVKPLSVELNKMFPQKSAAQHESHIMQGWNARVNAEKRIKAGEKNVKITREYRLLNQDANYIQLKEIRKMPFFNKGRFRSGLYTKAFFSRTKPYGTLSSRTIGDIFGEYDKGGKNGLEAHYDSLLRGESGTSTRRKVNGRFIDVVDIKPINGKDIISTIDIHIQDITEKALLNKLKEFDAESGTAVVMEVATGQIKAITNMGRVREGVWGETQNYAVSDLSEPGSTFKVVSMLVALEDGVVLPEDSVDTENGVVQMAGQILRDHNANRGGYGMITAGLSIRYSSNIGVARLIMKAYGNDPGKFVDGIRRIGFHQDMNLEIPGYGVPKIRHPKDENAQYWSRSTLPWMSFGYETQIPPIYTLAFFNAIANNGKLVKPMFVKEILDNGKVIDRKRTQVINEKIASETTLQAIRQMLDDVVNGERGTGSPAKSDKVRVAGKTGTAQLSQGAAGYRAGGLSHQVSFCGYFPSEKPQYSMIVVMRRPRNGAPSGGLMCGSVFKNIAEEVYARNKISEEALFPQDTIRPRIPVIKDGYADKSLTVLNNLKISHKNEHSNSKWITSELEENQLLLKSKEFPEGVIPNVRGMGAKDATFVLENLGLKVNLSGKGIVTSQSINSGAKIVKGQTIVLNLK